MMRKLLVLLVLVAMALPVASARAQDPSLMLGGPPASAFLPPAASGAAGVALNSSWGAPSVFNTALFTTMYNGLMNPINAATTGIAGGLTAWIAGWFVAAAGCVLLVLALGSMLGRFQDDVVIRWGLRSGAVMMIAASASGYQQWVAGPLLQLPTDIGHVVTGATGGNFTSGGSVFDQIMNSLWNASDAAVRGMSLLSISSIVITILSLLATAIGSFFLAGVFCFYVVTTALLQLLVGIGPLFVVCLVFVPTRHLFSGWLSAVASQIVTLTLIVVMLAIMTQLVLTSLGTVSAAGSNVNVMSALAALVSIAAELLVTLILCFSIRSIASGLVGGVMAELGLMTGALRAATSAASTALRGSGSGSSAGASASGSAANTGATSTFAGRNLSKGGLP
jgi:type IV secretion system protein VirB6